jgi:diguanylate cyclase (GGDEF)-like protein
MTEKLNKYLAFSTCGAGILANTIGLIFQILICYKKGNLLDIINIISIIATSFSLFSIIIFACFFFKRKAYTKFINAIVVVTAAIYFPIIFLTNRNDIFMFYLPMMGTAIGLLSINNWKNSAIWGIVVLLEYVSAIILKNTFNTIVLKIDTNFDYKKYLGAIISTYLFSAVVVSLTLKAFREANRKLSKEAEHDQLTTVYNRYRMDQDIKTKLYKYAAMIDIDWFKKVNDTYGHKAGDRALQQLSQSLLRYVTDDFRVYRYGGEEFLILCRSDEKDFLERLDMIWEDLELTFCLRQGEKLSVSIGAAFSEKSHRLISLADENLYKAKNNGRHQVWYNNKKIY